MLHELIKTVPADRVLFATAFPYANPAYKKAAILWELRDTSESIKNGIFFENSARLFGGKYHGNS